MFGNQLSRQRLGTLASPLLRFKHPSYNLMASRSLRLKCPLQTTLPKASFARRPPVQETSFLAQVLPASTPCSDKPGNAGAKMQHFVRLGLAAICVLKLPNVRQLQPSQKVPQRCPMENTLDTATRTMPYQAKG